MTVAVVVLMGLIGYWAVTTMQSGSEHINKQKISELQKENERLEKEVLALESRLKILEPEIEDTPEVPAPDTATPITYKHLALIKELEKLIEDNVLIKVGSRGTRVGTVQNFLNLYNNTSNNVDNDFGPSSKTLLIQFQKDSRLSADGEAGRSTFEKMIDWLKKQG